MIFGLMLSKVASAQAKPIDTIYFSLPRIKVVDSMVFRLLDSIVHAEKHTFPKRWQKHMIWRIRTFEDSSGITFITQPGLISEFDKNDVGYVLFNKQYYFIVIDENQCAESANILKKTTSRKQFFSVSINWVALWETNPDPKTVGPLMDMYASPFDPSVLILKREEKRWYMDTNANILF